MKRKKRTDIPERTVERLCSYRRILFRWRMRGKDWFHSHELAAEANITSAQVRRDLMSLNTIGTPKNGYITANIIEELGLIIEGAEGQKIVLVGAGNLGSAILSYFTGRRPDLKIIAAFDNDPDKIGKNLAAVPCLPLNELGDLVRNNEVLMGIITVPGNCAQDTADSLVAAGIKSIVNFTPAKLKVPAEVYVEDFDISIALEKSAYFGRMFAEKIANKKQTVDQTNKKIKTGGPMKRILCIEDDKDVIASYKVILEGAGYEVDVAFEGEEGLRKAREKKPDLIILDVMMKDATEGFHVAYNIRRDQNIMYTPILMLTAVSREWNVKFDKNKDGAYLPVDAFVDKPVAPNSLLSAVVKLLSMPKEQINLHGRDTE
jgi:redox-sensing transcriptional repressor